MSATSIVITIVFLFGSNIILHYVFLILFCCVFCDLCVWVFYTYFCMVEQKALVFFFF